MKINLHRMNTIFKFLALSFFSVPVLLHVPPNKAAQAGVRVKDVAYIQGVRDNQLYGYGLVTGLQGTGDSQIFKITRQMAVNIFQKMGVLISDSDFFSKNVAGVMITATTPAFARPGDKLDIIFSSLGY